MVGRPWKGLHLRRLPALRLREKAIAGARTAVNMAVNPVNASNSSQVAGAIQQAARSTGTSFEYLLTTARIESNLNPQAQAATTSARGLYQFIDQTWLSTMKQAGPALG